MSQITPHFSWSEAACKDGCEMPEDIKVHVRAMVRVLEAVRLALGGRPITVNSWYRCWDHHVAIYRARGIRDEDIPKKSTHLTALGTDIEVLGMTPAEVFEACKVLQEQGIVGGLESAPAHTHIDCGPTRTFEGASL